MPHGEYTLTEIKAPEGYRLLEIEKEFVVTDVDGDKTLNIDLGAIENYKAQIEWQKIDADSKELLGGSEWTITGEDGTEYEITDCVAESAESCEGLDLNPAEGEFAFAELGNGTYTLKETKAPEGYVLSDSSYEIVLTDEGYSINGGEVVPWAIDKDRNVIAILVGDIKNEKIRGAVSWTKIDPNKAPLAGSEWTIVRVNEDETPIDGLEPVKVIDCQDGDCAGLVDQNPAPGEFLIADLEYGKYKIQEVKAPVGFQLDATEHYIQINGDQEIVVAGSFVNELGKGIKLPLTGGVGSHLYMILGSLLGVIAAVSGGAHVMRRRI